jgi:hypothetical protein
MCPTQSESITLSCMTSGFHHGINDTFALLGCHTVYLVTDVSGEAICPILNGQVIFLDYRVSGQCLGSIFKGQAILGWLTREEGTERLSQNVSN